MKKYIKAGEDSYRQINDISELEDLVEQGYDSWDNAALSKVDYEICQYLDICKDYDCEYIVLEYPHVNYCQDVIKEMRRLGITTIAIDQLEAASVLLGYGCRATSTILDVNWYGRERPALLIEL